MASRPLREFLIRSGPLLSSFPQNLEAESHPEGDLQYEAEHAIGAIQQHTVCKVCARADSGDDYATMLCGGAHCLKYRSGDRFQQFVGLLIALQWDLHDWLLLKHDLPEPRAEFNIQQSHWWNFINLFEDACELGRQWLGRRFELMFEESSLPTLCGDIIDNVEEIRFKTPLYYNEGIAHCAFLITLDDGSEWVYDPTGVQFGPQWPLLAPFEDYCKRSLTSTLPREDAMLFYNIGDGFHEEMERCQRAGESTDWLELRP
ncbi:hypothetical protein E8E13_001935 [Curvularia kusanoi]|uniref:Uncharacterized protein n=1 Tax=Curvularia kusanoi TaxID=90978 RepID=A0A9P4T6A1_CURKU|nr:hypothetical protein E8E13_001935 [Curvularia kusanoi]